MIKKFLVILLVFISLQGNAQTSLSLPEFLAIVRKYHPVSRQAGIDVEIARAEITVARGGFDPLFNQELARKEFGGLLYYNHQLSQVQIPTWFGIDVVAGIETLNGNRTSTPDTKGASSYLGFSVPVGKGLLMDGRRAALQQAKIFTRLSLQQQQSVLNDLFYEAVKVYYTWWQEQQLQQLFQQAVNNAAQRLRLVKTAAELGDRPAIDTVEALAQLQAFQLRQAEIDVSVANAQLEVNNFLWQEDGSTYTLPASVRPQLTVQFAEALQPENLLKQLEQHPDLQQYRYKLDALVIERKLKFQSLLPSIYLKYNQLSSSHDLRKTFTTPWLQNNYQHGIGVAVPLRLSEGRGLYRQAKLKIDQTILDQANKKMLLQTKLLAQYNEWMGLQKQLAIQRSAIASFTALQRGEEVKFLNGESSLFLVNARELKRLEAEQKQIELQGKEQKAVAGIFWSAGNIANVLR